MMGLSFFAPFLLAGTALIAVPWLLHHIRRPEREPVPFSSLLFVPNIQKEVIERRRIQHLLLMLFRMLLFFLLFFAFARPFWSSAVQPEVGEHSTIHAIVLDRSYSMGVNNRFEAAKRRAGQIIDALSPNDYALLIGFDHQPEVFFDWELGQVSPVRSQDIAREQLDLVPLSNNTTALIRALQSTEQVLLNLIQAVEEKQPRLQIHLISDFQREGVPKEGTTWKLASKIQLNPVSIVEEDGAANPFSILDSTVRDQIDSYRIIGKIKNWTEQDQSVGVELWLSGEPKEGKEVFIKAGSASQVFFNVPKENMDTVWGRLRIGEDALALDNRHYFVHNPVQKQPVLLISSNVRRTSSSAWFVYQALTHSEKLPWEVQSVAANEVVWSEVDSNTLMILCDWEEAGEDFPALFRAAVQSGSKAVVTVDEATSKEKRNELLGYWNWNSLGLNVEQMDPRRFQLLAWMDFQHPVFEIFRNQKFNDFSTIRFYRYHQLRATDDTEHQTVAWFEAGEDGIQYPALLDIHEGEGRVMLLPFGMQLDWTNFPKSKKFVPVWHEMLSYLQGDLQSDDTWLVGQEIQLPALLEEAGDTAVWFDPLGEDTDAYRWRDYTDRTFSQPGLWHWKASVRDALPLLTYAVNVQTDESDITPIPTDEFVLRYCAAPNLEEDGDVKPERVLREEIEYRHEFGIFMIVAFFGLVMFEMWYASQLT